MLLGGMSATEIVFGEADGGVHSDMKRAYNIMGSLIDDFFIYGFDLCKERNSVSSDLLRKREELMAREIDRYYREVKDLLIQNRAFLDKLAGALIQKKTLVFKEIQDIKNNV